MHSILSGAGEVSEEILDGSKNISKYCLLLPDRPSGEPGNYVIVMDTIVAKGAPLWDTWPLFFMESLLTFENYKLLSSLNNTPFSTKLFQM